MKLNQPCSNQNLTFNEMDSNQNLIFREFESRAMNWATQLQGRLGSLVTEKKRQTSDLGSESPTSYASGLSLRESPTPVGKPLALCSLGPNTSAVPQVPSRRNLQGLDTPSLFSYVWSDCSSIRLRQQSLIAPCYVIGRISAMLRGSSSSSDAFGGISVTDARGSEE
jgi:hypothetical protein